MKDNLLPLTKQKLTGIILREKLKSPHLSCRKLSSLISDKYDQQISKSAINILLKKNNFQELKGRKKEESQYRKPHYPYCGLFFLKTINELMQVSSTLARLMTQADTVLKVPETELKKYLDFLIYASFFSFPVREFSPDSAHLNLLYALSDNSSLQFNRLRLQKIITHLGNNPIHAAEHPEIQSCLTPVTHLQLHTSAGHILAIDSSCTQWWENLSSACLYQTNLTAARGLVKSIIDSRRIPVMCTTSMQEFSPALIKALAFCPKGISTIDFCDGPAAIESAMIQKPVPLDIIVGFNPQVLKKCCNVVSSVEKSRLALPGFSDLCAVYDFDGILHQHTVKEATKVRILLIQKSAGRDTYWGIVTTLNRSVHTAKDIIQEYFNHWLHPYEMYLLHLQLRERSTFTPRSTELPLPAVPLSGIVLHTPEDFKQILTILKEYTRQWLLQKLIDTKQVPFLMEEILSTEGYMLQGKKINTIQLIKKPEYNTPLLPQLALLANKESFFLNQRKTFFNVVAGTPRTKSAVL